MGGPETERRARFSGAELRGDLIDPAGDVTGAYTPRQEITNRYSPRESPFVFATRKPMHTHTHPGLCSPSLRSRQGRAAAGSAAPRTKIYGGFLLLGIYDNVRGEQL